jgi:hypothetical protein
MLITCELDNLIRYARRRIPPLGRLGRKAARDAVLDRFRVVRNRWKNGNVPRTQYIIFIYIRRAGAEPNQRALGTCVLRMERVLKYGTALLECRLSIPPEHMCGHNVALARNHCACAQRYYWWHNGVAHSIVIIPKLIFTCSPCKLQVKQYAVYTSWRVHYALVHACVFRWISNPRTLCFISPQQYVIVLRAPDVQYYRCRKDRARSEGFRKYVDRSE